MARVGTEASFSIVIESANLAMAEPERVLASLDSLAAQVPSPALAQSVVLLDGGDVPAALLQTIHWRYPWVSIQPVAAGIGYGDQKSMSASLTHADILFFADSDCVYLPGWIAAMLHTFAARPDIKFIAGETTIAITGPFTLAMALVFFFPRFSLEADVAAARGFNWNNVAFRREVSGMCTFPLDLPVFRVQNVMQSRLLHEAGVTIWREPRARAYHSPPEGLIQALQRLFIAGRDIRRLAQLTRPPLDAPFQGAFEPYDRPAGRVRKVLKRLQSIARQEPAKLFFLPVALPIAFACVTAFLAGMASERVGRTVPVHDSLPGQELTETQRPR